MIRNLSFWFCLAVFCQLVGSTDCQWHCGSGSVSEKLAWALTFNSDRDKINGCCKQHDKDYEMVEKGLWPWSRRYADLLFGSCLEKVCSSFYDRYIVRPVFVVAVRVNSWLCRILGVFC